MLSKEEARHILLYGKGANGLKLKDSGKYLDWVISAAFELLRKHTIFEVDEAEHLFWERITSLANLNHPTDANAQS